MNMSVGCVVFLLLYETNYIVSTSDTSLAYIILMVCQLGIIVVESLLVTFTSCRRRLHFSHLGNCRVILFIIHVIYWYAVLLLSLQCLAEKRKDFDC